MRGTQSRREGAASGPSVVITLPATYSGDSIIERNTLASEAKPATMPSAAQLRETAAVASVSETARTAEGRVRDMILLEWGRRDTLPRSPSSRPGAQRQSSRMRPPFRPFPGAETASSRRNSLRGTQSRPEDAVSRPTRRRAR
ncbi:hypothetical protein GCM10009643_12760 [Microbacterium aurantiacum]